MVGCGTVGVDIPNSDLSFTFSCPRCGYTAIRHENRTAKCRDCGTMMHARAPAIDKAEDDLNQLLHGSHSTIYLIDALDRTRAHFTQAANLDPDWKPLIRRIDEIIDRIGAGTRVDISDDW